MAMRSRLLLAASTGQRSVRVLPQSTLPAGAQITRGAQGMRILSKGSGVRSQARGMELWITNSCMQMY